MDLFRAAPVVVLCAATMFAQVQSSEPKQKTHPVLPNLQQEAVSAKERPITTLPYTPSLDLDAMDKSADPCVDFYQYTCGGWRKSNPIPSDQATWSVYSKLEEDNQRFLWGILDEAAKDKVNKTAVQQKIGDYFGSCMDASAVEKLGITPLKSLLAQIDGLKSISDIAVLLAKLHLSSYGRGLMFSFGSSQDFGDASQIIAFADAGGLGLPDRDYYFKADARTKEIRAAYVQHVQNMLQLLGEPKQKAAADSATIMRIETALAKASLTRVDRRDPYRLYHKMTFVEFQKLTPSIRWNQYLATIKKPELTTVNVAEPEFYKALDTQLRNESLSNWKTYLRWHLASAQAPYLSSAFVNENFSFYFRKLRGIDELPPRWKRCVRYVDRDLGEALGQEFVRRTFANKTKADTLQMTQLIEQAMDDEIHKLDWMSSETKKQALIKLHSIRNKIGFPDKWRDYSSVTVTAGDFFGNVSRATEFETNRQLNKIGKPVDRSEWDMSPPTVNAYYNPQMNDINFPAGVLQPPLYDPKMDDAPNYGNTGATIGHELTHGFDDEGRQFDATGNLKDWWTKEDAEGFETRINCIRDQYSQYVIVDDIKINGKLTSGEDVADLGGTWLAYLAWKMASEGKTLMPIDGFTPDQRFFIGMAQWACENQRPENLRMSAITNPHSPGKYRINGVVTNMPEFQKAFGCKAGQPMYKENVCKVW